MKDYLQTLLFWFYLPTLFFVVLDSCTKGPMQEGQSDLTGHWYLPQVRPEIVYLYEFTGQTMKRIRFNNGTQDETLTRSYTQENDTISVGNIYDLPVRKWLVQVSGDSAIFTDITPNAHYGVDYTLIRY